LSSFDLQLLISDQMNEEAGEKAADHIMKMKKTPDGVFCANDTTAVHYMQVRKTKGL
jgi:DNA-binding LacI/PurR family transcriptional regulator